MPEAALTISNNMRSLRFHAGEMTQRELAQRVGVSRQAIVNIETGKYTPSLELAFRIARAFRREIGEVFVCDEELPPETETA